MMLVSEYSWPEPASGGKSDVVFAEGTAVVESDAEDREDEGKEENEDEGEDEDEVGSRAKAQELRGSE